MHNSRMSQQGLREDAFGRCVRYGLLTLATVLTLSTAPVSAQTHSVRERLEAMSAEEKEELAAKRERFEKLSVEEQRRIRELDQELATDPQSEQLRGVMNRYHEWLKTLSSEERATLLSKTGEERIEMIRILTFRSMADRRLSQEDLEIVYDWTTAYLRSREERMIASLPEDRRREVEEIDDESHRWRKLFWLMRSRQMPPQMLPTEDDVSELISQLSAEARQIFAAAPDDEKRRDLVQSWVRASMFSRMQQSISESELLTFLEEKLDPRIRSHIESLPREEMQNELRKHYLFHKFRGFGGPRFGPPGPPPGRRHDDEDRDRRDFGPGGRGPDDDRSRRDFDRDERGRGPRRPE